MGEVSRSNLEVVGVKVSCFLIGMALALIPRAYDHFIQQTERHERDLKASQGGLSDAEARLLQELQTSIFCSGTDRYRRCRFRNLCYQPPSPEESRPGDFFALVNHNSTFVGLDDRNEDGNWTGFHRLVQLTSVRDLNQFAMSVQALPLRADVVRRFNVQHVTSPVFLMSRSLPSNLAHLFVENLIPLYFTLEDLCVGDVGSCVRTIFLMFLDRDPESVQQDLMMSFLPKGYVVRSSMDPNTLFCFQEVYAGFSSRGIFFDFGRELVGGGPLPEMTLNGYDLRRFADYVIRAIDEVARSIVPEFRHRFTCDRKYLETDGVLLVRKGNRLILNEEEVLETMKNALTRHWEKFPEDEDENGECRDPQVLSMSLEQNTIPEMICALSNSQLAVGMHGALLTLAIFLPPYASLVELYPFALNRDTPGLDPYKTMVTLPGMEISYSSWQNRNSSRTVTHPSRSPHLGGIRHLPESVQREIEESESVPPTKCCEDPRLNYRLYQDTRVSVDELDGVLQEVLWDAEERLGQSPAKDVLPLTLSIPEDLECRVVANERILVSWRPPMNLEYFHRGNSSAIYETRVHILVHLNPHQKISDPTNTNVVEEFEWKQLPPRNTTHTNLEIRLDEPLCPNCDVVASTACFIDGVVRGSFAPVLTCSR